MKLGVLLLTLTLSSLVFAEAKKKVRVKYKAYSEFDFSGQKVAGKIKTPAVFYVFQRRRSEGHQVVSVPQKFQTHKVMSKKRLEELLKEN